MQARPNSPAGSGARQWPAPIAIELELGEQTIAEQLRGRDLKIGDNASAVNALGATPAAVDQALGERITAKQLAPCGDE